MEGLLILLTIFGFIIWIVALIDKNKDQGKLSKRDKEYLKSHRSRLTKEQKRRAKRKASRLPNYEPKSKNEENYSTDEELSNFRITVQLGNNSGTNKKNDYKWFGRGEEVNVKGYSLKDIYVYIGKYLETGYNTEPSLINPNLPINNNSPDFEAETMHYWPSYNHCTPEARAAYLHYCSKSFTDEGTPKGYVFMYYYGLERRLLVDDLDNDERNNLIYEVERLRKIHGSNRSFNGYSGRLLRYLKTEAISKDNIDHSLIDSYEQKLSSRKSDLTEQDKLQLGYHFILGIDIPSNLLFKVGLDNITSLGTAGRRCFKELNELFKVRLSDHYRHINTWSNSKNKIKFSYSPASSALRGERLEKETDIPDILSANDNQRLVQEISNLIIECEEDLESYSRLLANDDNRNSLQALARIPSELINEDDHPGVSKFVNELDLELEGNEFTLVDASQLTNLWDIEGVNKFRKKYAIEVAQVFHHLGYGIEPDIRFGYHKIDKEGKIAVFNIDKENTPRKPTKEYKLVLPIIHMTALVGLADGIFKPEEEKHFEEYIESLMHLNDEEKKRINGYLYWLKSAGVNVSRLKNKITKLNNSDKTRIIEYLISLAWADHHIHPDEVSMLQKLADLFGVDESKVLKKLYALQHGEDDELVQVTTKSGSSGYTVPKEKRDSGLLNEELLQARIDQTNAVQSILSDVFEEEEDEEIENSESINKEEDFTSYLGLDKQHSQLVGKLISKEAWTKEEFNKLCSDIGLMPNGAIEIINEMSYEKHEDDLLLMYDELEINEYITDKL